MEENLPYDDTLAGGEQNVPLADGSEAVSEVEALGLSELNQLTGKNFPTKEAALKSIKDTFSYVGQVGQLKNELAQVKAAVANPTDVNSKLQSLETQLKEASFYAEHPEYKDVKSLIQKFGSDPAQVVADPDFQKAYTAIKTSAELEQSKSVLQSNPRLGQVTDKLTQAREAQQAGNTAAAADAATQAVIDAFGMK